MVSAIEEDVEEAEAHQEAVEHPGVVVHPEEVAAAQRVEPGL